MPKIRSARGQVFDTDLMNPSQIADEASYLDHNENDVVAASQLMAVFFDRGGVYVERDSRHEGCGAMHRFCRCYG